MPERDLRGYVSGRVASFPTSNERSIQFTVTVDSVVYGTVRVRSTGKLQVSLWKPFAEPITTYPAVRYQDRVRLHGMPEEIRPRGNPADFDYKAYLAGRGIYVGMETSRPEQITVRGNEASLFDRTIMSVRLYVRRAILSRIPSNGGRTILLALLLGDRSRIQPGTQREFQRTGLMHLLAISGLHVMMIGLIAYNLLRPFLLRSGMSWTGMEWTRSAVTMIILIIYGLITGAPPSVVRALVMTGIFLGGVLSQRTYEPLNALGAAGLLLLCLNPSQLYDAGFQLSFGAVGGILLITPVLERIGYRRLRRHQIGRHVLATTYVSTAATLGTIPVTLYHFGHVALAGIVLNVLAIPLATVVLAGAVSVVAFHGIAGRLAEAVGYTVDAAVHMLLGTATYGARLFSWTVLETSVREPVILLSLCIGLLIPAVWHRLRLRSCLIILSFSLLTIYIWIQTLARQPNSLELLFFDVGQGDASLIELPNRRYMLVDGGDRSSFRDEGRQTIIPHLKRFGIRRLSAVIISHAHRDHIGGLVSVLQRVPVGRIIYNGHEMPSSLLARVRHLADSLDIPLLPVTAGDTLLVDNRVRVQVLGPRRRPGPYTDGNNASVVFRLMFREITCLFTGDIERRGEHFLTERMEDLLPSDLVKVPHHGSESSSTPALVHAVTSNRGDAHTVIVSAGRDNRFDHPHPQIIGRWKSAGARVLETTNGAVWLRTNGYRFDRIHWR